MPLNEALETAVEAFEGNVRKLDELVSQLELWSDECTINHKKEEVRLPQYIELHLNLEALKEELKDEISTLSKEEALREAVSTQEKHIHAHLEKYKETEAIIHGWIREIKNIYVLMNQSRVLEENKDYLMNIIEAQ